jgi:hypothetical protein
MLTSKSTKRRCFFQRLFDEGLEGKLPKKGKAPLLDTDPIGWVTPRDKFIQAKDLEKKKAHGLGLFPFSFLKPY